jgi:radical SAM enzyme (TIGR01210 family)
MKEVTTFIRKLREKIPAKTYDVTKIALFDTNHVACLNGRFTGKVIIELRASGCEWCLKSGGCTMCGQIAETTRGKEVFSESYIKQVLEAIEKYDFKRYPIVCIYNSGSFLNDRELPPKARRGILKILSENADIKKIIIETRPEFITKEKVMEIRNILKDKIVELGVGLESSNDEIRRHCINKGFTLKEFEKSVIKVKGILDLLVYVLIKPPFLTEKEGIEDAVQSAKYALNFGAKAVSFEPCSMQKYTLVELLCKYKLWRLPWLWSVIEVAKTTYPIAQNADAEIRLGGFEFLPRPLLTPYNGVNYKPCKDCNDIIKKTIREYNKTNDISQFDTLSCSCKEDWRKELHKKSPPLEERIDETLSFLDTFLKINDSKGEYVYGELMRIGEIEGEV